MCRFIAPVEPGFAFLLYHSTAFGVHWDAPALWGPSQDYADKQALIEFAPTCGAAHSLLATRRRLGPFLEIICGIGDNLIKVKRQLIGLAGAQCSCWLRLPEIA